MYESFYNLLRQPFQLSPDASFFFSSSGHGRALDYLTFGLAQGEGFIVITGAVGAGKTTLLEHMLGGLDREHYVASKIVTSRLDADNILRFSASGFGLDVRGKDKAEILDQMRDFLIATHRSGRRSILIVDEVQNLPMPALEELRMLSNLQDGPRPILQTILVGQPQFRPIMSSPELEQLRQRIIASFHLQPLKAEEVRRYVEHRLQVAGWRNDPALSEDFFDALQRLTNGVPRRINTLCSRLLLFGAVEEKHILTANDVENVATGMAEELETPADAENLPSPDDEPQVKTEKRPRAELHVIETPKTDPEPAAQAIPSRDYPSQGLGFSMVNAMSIDVEDYFHVEAFARHLDRRDWPRFECRVERNVDRILEMLDAQGQRATFFTLGWVAERYGPMVRRIVDNGHELASHGMAHIRADKQSPRDFRADVAASKRLLEDVGGVAVRGYRAASFSIGAANPWAFQVLAEEGFSYSSSVNPIKHDLYGMPDAPRFPFQPANAPGFLEIPISTIRGWGRNKPCGGGGFFRLLSYDSFTKRIRKVNEREKQPTVFYFHPWEIDPGQPRIKRGGFKTRFRHYHNLDRMEAKLARLFKDFRWDRMDRVFLGQETRPSERSSDARRSA